MGLFSTKNRPHKYKVTRDEDSFRQMMREEARIGGQVFGTLPGGGKREFFCLDSRTWIWHEEWTDETGKYHHFTTKYEVKPDKILKFQNGSEFMVNVEEAYNLLHAARNYQGRVAREVYGAAASK